MALPYTGEWLVIVSNNLRWEGLNYGHLQANGSNVLRIPRLAQGVPLFLRLPDKTINPFQVAAVTFGLHVNPPLFARKKAPEGAHVCEPVLMTLYVRKGLKRTRFDNLLLGFTAFTQNISKWNKDYFQSHKIAKYSFHALKRILEKNPSVD